ncbi:hypothetical protein [Novosphingobium sp. B 225]|uniref:hypothetical protein n=1 Tax=Novosphingobium sp. B 225 TaxID=1961849 RepID=UPI000B4ADDF1|nr:hypothetical protein [Novosphingobium sp. B 225]
MPAIPFALIQLAGSIVAILLVALLAAKLRLGDDVRLQGEDEARELAALSLAGFAAQEVALDRAGIGALLRDGQGRVMLLRRHGAQFAARLLDSHAFARLDRNFLTIGTGEKTFGQVTLDLGSEAQVWAASLRRLGGA